MSARDRILSRVREAVASRATLPHPGPFGAWRPDPVEESSVEGFVRLFRLAGGEAHLVDDEQEASEWMLRFADGFESITIGRGVPASLHPDLPVTEASAAALGVSFARGAVAESGSLLLDARDGRRSQLLAPVHVVILRADTVSGTVREALTSLRHDLPSAIAMHSGPSKSADIGQVMVRGVHGPGRVIALVVGASEG